MEQVKLVCSYGGKLKACPISKNLIYCGGETRLIIVNRNIDFQELVGKLSCKCGGGGGTVAGMKYQVPGEDLDLLVSLTNDDDLENMMLEYDTNRTTVKSLRIRLFLDFQKPPSSNTNILHTESANLNPDYLFGFDKDVDYSKLIDEKALEEWRIPRAHKYDRDLEESIRRCQDGRRAANNDQDAKKRMAEVAHYMRGTMDQILKKRPAYNYYQM